jgi:Reprolysin (M12B) family zinc metalloprotease/WW domain
LNSLLNSLSLSLQTWSFDLTRNHALFTENYIERVSDGDTVVSERRPDTRVENCHYIGTVAGEPNTHVAASTCNGVMHALVIGVEGGYYIEPAEPHFAAASISTAPSHIRVNGKEANHIFYRLSDMPMFERSCESSSSSSSSDNLATPTKKQSSSLWTHMSSLIDKLRAMNNRNTPDAGNDSSPQLQATKTVELIAIADSAQYNRNGQSVSTTQSLVVTLTNMVNVLYAATASGGSSATLNPTVQVTLALNQVFTTDPWASTVSGSVVSATNLLNAAVAWRDNNLASGQAAFGTDNVQVYSGKSFSGSTIGLAYVGTMCTFELSGGVNQVTHSNAFDAATIAHEMGHNFDMIHDSGVCGNSYIMSATASSPVPTQWSTCSQSAYAKFAGAGAAACLIASNGGGYSAYEGEEESSSFLTMAVLFGVGAFLVFSALSYFRRRRRRQQQNAAIASGAAGAVQMQPPSYGQQPPQSQWQPPAQQQPAEGQVPLPPYWVEYFDNTRRPYYYNTQTQQTQWQRPQK